jgi:predicted DNA-binding antitoxin AbrB/MazE fold protein
MIVIDVVYRDGVFKPKQPVNLPEGTQGVVRFDSRDTLEAAAAKQDPAQIAKWIKSIANSSTSQPPQDGLSNRDHDQILYGKK